MNHDQSLEGYILGACLLEKNVFFQQDLFEELFYSETHQLIYRALTHLSQKDQPVDAVTVVAQLRSEGQLEKVGGPTTVTSLTNQVGSTANIDYYVRLLYEKWIFRQIGRIANQLNYEAKLEREDRSQSTDVFELLEWLDQQVQRISSLESDQYEAVANTLPDVFRQIEATQQNSLLGVPSGNTELDRCLQGFVSTRLTVVAARPGMGKTSKMLAWAHFQAKQGVPTGMISLEMGARELSYRLLSLESGIPNDQILNGDLSKEDWQALNHASAQLEQLPLYIESRSGLTMLQIKAVYRRMIKENGVKIGYLDYAQITGKSNPKLDLTTHNTEVAQTAKGLARSLDIPIILFSQLNRSVETRGGAKRPILSDLRESGAFEENADQVVFLYRPAYYGITEDEDGQSTDNVLEQIVAKNRHGPTGTYKEYANMGTSHFKEFENTFKPANEAPF